MQVRGGGKVLMFTVSFLRRYPEREDPRYKHKYDKKGNLKKKYQKKEEAGTGVGVVLMLLIIVVYTFKFMKLFS